MNAAPQIGDVFRIHTRELSTFGTVTKINRVTLTYDTTYDVGNVHEVYSLKLPLEQWQFAEVAKRPDYSDYRCVFIDACDGSGECYQCGQSREAHHHKTDK